MRVNVVSETIQEFAGVRYYRCGRYFQRKGVRLHRTVWEHYHGPVPAGHHVHHVTGDTARNQIEDLGLMQGGEHLRMHASTPERREMSRHLIVNARSAAAAWHGSEAGRAWHSRHHAANIAPVLARRVEKNCQQCGEPYRAAASFAHRSRFCSDECRGIARRLSGVDYEHRQCAACHNQFRARKIHGTRACSPACRRKLRESE